MDGTASVPGVEQQEVARPVGVLRLADREAGLAEERGLLVAEVPGDGIPASPFLASPYVSLEARISGSIARGTPRIPRISSSQSSVSRSIIIVRLALVTSVT